MSSTDDGDGTGIPLIVFPSNVVGVHFEVSSTIDASRASVRAAGREWNESSTRTIRFLQDTATNEVSVLPDGQLASNFDLSTWVFKNSESPLDFVDIPTETVVGITSVDFFFSPEISTFPQHQLSFSADGRQPDGTFLGGTTTFANVSWIISDEPTTNPIPEPSSLALFGIGGLSLCGYGWRRRKKTKTV